MVLRFGPSGGYALGHGGLAFGGSGGTPTPTYVAPTPLYYDDFNSYPDETIMVGGAPGWNAYSSTGATSNEKFNAAVVGGQLTRRTTGSVGDFTTVGSATQSGKYLISPPVAFRPNSHMVRATLGTLVSSISIELGAIDEINKIEAQLSTGTAVQHFNGSGAAPTAGTGTSSFVSTGRFMGNSSEGAVSTGNAKPAVAGHVFERKLFNGRLYLTRFGAPLNPLAGVDVSAYSSLATGTRVGLRHFNSESRNLNDMLATNIAGVLKFTETDIRLHYPRVQGLGGYTNGARDITFTGTYEWDTTAPVPGNPSGIADPTGFFWGLDNPETGATVLAPQWVATKTITRTGITGNIATGTWSITVRVPCGLDGRNPYRLRLTCADDLFVEARSSRIFYVSYTALVHGQSNSKLVFNGAGASQPNHPGGGFYKPADSPSLVEPGITPTNVWGSTTTNSGTGNATAHITEILGAALNLPVYLVNIGTGGVGAINLAPGGSAYSYAMRHLEFGTNTPANSNTGIFDAIYYIQGEQEINAAYIYNWTATVQTLVADLRAKNLQPPGTFVPFFYVLTGRYQTASPPDAARDARANALRVEQMALESQISDAYLANHMSGAAMDGAGYPGTPTVHFALTAGGYERWVRRGALTMRKVLAGGAYDGLGPKATALTRTSTNNFEITVNLNGAASLSGTALTGYEISINGFSSNLTISSIGVSGGKIVIVTTGDDGTSQAQVRNYRGFDPADSSNALGTYADGTTIELFPIIVPLST